jgi:hypothetical protein
MIFGPNVCIETDRFSLAVDEGGFRHGQELARWIAAEFPSWGEELGEVMAEDWGWRMPVRDPAFHLWLGCGIRDGATTEWLVFAASEPGVLRRLFRRGDPRPRLEQLTAKLQDLASSAPWVRRVWLEESGP